MLTRFFLAYVLLATSLCAQASLVMQGSRVIYEEARGEAVVHLSYVGEHPILLQAWLDDGTEVLDPGEYATPFILTPAATRVEPGNGQSIRILRTGTGLAQDRETMLFFNTLEVPPAPTEQIAAGDAFLQFAFRGRWKFFYRPKGLPYPARQALERLQFTLDAPTLPDGRGQLRIHNPTPYHITFVNLSVRLANAADDAPVLLEFDHQGPDERMVLPLEDLYMALEWRAAASLAELPESGLIVEYRTINDAGGHSRGQHELGR